MAYSLEWNGLKFVYGGDGRPNKLWKEYATGADLLIHECFITVDLLMHKFGFSKEMAVSVGTHVHTAPEQAGVVFSETKPKLAVAYHFFNDYETIAEVGSHIRKTYQGPLSLAKDLRVYNITPDGIVEREVRYNEDNWPGRSKDYVPPNQLTFGKKTGMSDFITENDWIIPVDVD